MYRQCSHDCDERIFYVPKTTFCQAECYSNGKNQFKLTPLKVTLKIEGISCNSCAKTIENHLINKQCSKINVSSVLGEASFEIKQDFPVKEITDSLSKLGYPSKKKIRMKPKKINLGITIDKADYMYSIYYSSPIAYGCPQQIDT